MKKIIIGTIIFLATNILYSQTISTPYIIKNDNEYTVYIDRQIYDKVYYRDLFYILTHSTSEEKIIFVVNSPGGVAMTGIHLYNAIKNCKSETVAIVTQAHSAASFIPVACKKVHINTGAMMLIHNIQIGQIGGDSGKVKKQVDLINLWCKEFYYKIYKDILTVEEINNIFDGEEIIFLEDELKKRFKGKLL